MRDRGIRPELEVFDLGMMNYAHYLIRKGYLSPPYYFNFILGNVSGAQANPSHLGMLINELPEDSVWCAGGIGVAQTPAAMMALAAGGGVRIGLEDNLWYDPARTILASNVALVQRVNRMAQECSAVPMTASTLRSLLGMEP